MNLAQMEHTRTLQEPLPKQTTFDRLAYLFECRQRDTTIIENKERSVRLYDEKHDGADSDLRQMWMKRIDESTERRARVEREIAEVVIEFAAQLVAEAETR